MTREEINAFCGSLRAVTHVVHMGRDHLRKSKRY